MLSSVKQLSKSTIKNLYQESKVVYNETADLLIDNALPANK
jgi:hypothetical protein